MFIVVLLGQFLLRFSKFRFLTFENRVFEFCFWLCTKILVCAGWAISETILSHTEPTRKQFRRWLCQRWTNFRVCYASESNFGSFFIDIRQKAKPARKEFHRCLSKRAKNSIAYRVIAETILSLIESTRKWFVIAYWVNVEIFHKLTAQSQSLYFIEPASLSSELGIYELITRPSSHSQPVAIISELLNRIRADSLS